MIDTAMILAAGKGTRMRLAPSDPPKPLTDIAGQSLLVRMIKRLEAAGINRIIINMRYKAAAIEAAVQAYEGAADLVLSDERAAPLKTGGGVKKALPLLGDAPFLVANGDVLWRENTPILTAMIDQFEAHKMDALLLLAARTHATGYDGTGDYHLADSGLLTRKTAAEAAHIFAGVQILSPHLFADSPAGAFSLNHIYDVAQSDGRLYGTVLDGMWMHVGTPEGRAAAQAAFD